MRYFVLIHQDEDGGFWGECPELPGCFSQGETPEELMSNMREAIDLYLRESDEAEYAEKIYEVRELVI